MGKVSQTVSKYGQPIYRTNPSIPSAEEIAKPKRKQYGTPRAGIIVDPDTDEIIGRGTAVFYENKPADREQFVKLYVDGVNGQVRLSKAGLLVFSLVFAQLLDEKEQDVVALASGTSGLTQSTFSRGMRELIDREFLYRSPNPGLFWVNVRYMFNGDRLAFVQTYSLKRDQRMEQGASTTYDAGGEAQAVVEEMETDPRQPQLFGEARA